MLREAAASARSQPVASTVTVLMVIGMILAVMLTTGRTVGAEQQVLGTLDSAGTRSIIIRAEQGAGVTAAVLERIGGIEGIEWAGAFSPAQDATNTAIIDGNRVPVRYAYGTHLARLGIPDRAHDGDLAWASPTALEQLGLPDVAGGITLAGGASIGIAGPLTVPEELRDFEPLVLAPRADPADPVGIVVIVSDRPERVAPVSAAVLSVLGADDPGKVTVQTSEALATLRSLIQKQLGSFSRGLVLALLALMGALVAILLYGLVMMRRKDFGRRRALGATRGLIMTLLLMQTALLAAAGILIGTGIAVIVLLVSGDPLPGGVFVSALATLALATTMVAALIPALIASRREPIRELRVP